MIEKLKQLDDLLKCQEVKAESIKTKKTAFEKELEDDISQLKAYEVDIANLKLEIEPLALKESIDLGKKTLDCGIVVKSTKSLIYDESKAFDFAKEKNLWLALDKKGFEKSVPTLNLDWVTTKTVEKVTFPKALKL